MSNYFEPKEKIFIEERITHPFFNQACADVLKKSFKWFVDSDISDEAIKVRIGITKDELISSTEYALGDIMRINSERLEKPTNELLFVRPHNYEIYRDILNSTEEICCGNKILSKRDAAYLTEYGKEYLRSLYRNYFNITATTDKQIEIEYLCCIDNMFLFIYRCGLPVDDD